jgi:hypothetical protein
MYGTVAGQLTMVLDGSATNIFKVTIPPIVISATVATAVNFGTTPNCVSVTWTGAASDFGDGSTVTLAGFVYRPPFNPPNYPPLPNGSFPIRLMDGGGNQFYIDQPLATGYVTPAFAYPYQDINPPYDITPITLSGYAITMPTVIFGNDDTAAPTGLGMRIAVDYFSFVWNPALSPANTLTPSPIYSRYWNV